MQGQPAKCASKRHTGGAIKTIGRQTEQPRLRAARRSHDMSHVSPTKQGSRTPTQETWVSRRGESHPPALAEPDVNLSIHPAPIVQPSGRTPKRQCANSPGSRLKTAARNLRALAG